MQLLNAITALQPTPTGVVATVDDRHRVDVQVLADDIVRIWVRKDGVSALSRTWTVTPDGSDVPWQGRDRADLTGFDLPQVSVNVTEDHAEIRWADQRVLVDSAPLRLTVQRQSGDEWTTIVADRPTGAYYVGSDAVDGLKGAPERTDVRHYLDLPAEERIFGLGDKGGELERTGQTYELRNVDAMGYDSRTTDPLYKLVPFTVSRTATDHFGIYYDNLSAARVNLGRVIDNYHRRFRDWHAEAGDIDAYIITGSSIEEVTRRFVALTGRPAFPPRWSIGYSQSTMTYPDMPDAQEQLKGFIERCKAHRIPIGSFQMGSGYTTIGTKRYLFHWNRDKFPDPRELADYYHSNGVFWTANIKPCMLLSHPRYQEVAEAGLFVKNGQGEPEISQFWDEMGSHLDLTNPDTVAWWKKNCTEQLLEFGVDVPWNDNNEFEIWDENAVCDGFGDPVPVSMMRPVLTLLNTRASFEAQQEYTPDKRPFSVSRSGGPGIQRYAQTWSGDNSTSWESLKYNIPLGLSMSLSGMYNYGHDVGGFRGEHQPDPELFVRWVQNGAMHPRFTLNSWHVDGTVNEPWMHAEVIDEIRAAVELRARLTPLFYDLLHSAHAAYAPVLRPMFFVDESDEKLWEPTDDFMLGPDVLVASVVTPGARTREVYLPRVCDWYEFDTGVRHAGGQTVVLDAPLERIPLLVRAGSAIPLQDVPEQSGDWVDEVRTLLLFPPAVGEVASGSWFEDDGETRDGASLTITWQQRSFEDRLEVSIDPVGTWTPAWTTLSLRLPAGDSRRLVVNGVETDEVPLTR